MSRLPCKFTELFARNIPTRIYGYSKEWVGDSLQTAFYSQDTGTLFGFGYSATSGNLAPVIWRSLHVISWVGVGLAFLVGFGSFGAYFAKKGAEGEWNRLVSSEVRQHFPRIDAAARFKWLGSLTSGALCTFIFSIWLYIIFFVLPQ